MFSKRRARPRSAVAAALLGIALPLLFGASPVDVYQFDSAAQEARYRALLGEFRCPKCQNTDLAGSDARIAQDLRQTVHRLVVREGKTDIEVRDYLQARYGDFVLYNPPFKPATYALWLGPGVLLIAGIIVIWRLTRRARHRAVAPDAAADARLAAILSRERDPDGLGD